MEYTKLGNTDIEVSKICMGCMSFGKSNKNKSKTRRNVVRWKEITYFGIKNYS